METHRSQVFRLILLTVCILSANLVSTRSEPVSSQSPVNHTAQISLR